MTNELRAYQRINVPPPPIARVAPASVNANEAAARFNVTLKCFLLRRRENISAYIVPNDSLEATELSCIEYRAVLRLENAPATSICNFLERRIGGVDRLMSIGVGLRKDENNTGTV